MVRHFLQRPARHPARLAKVAVRPDLDVSGGAYIVDQNDFYNFYGNGKKAAPHRHNASNKINEEDEFEDD